MYDTKQFFLVVWLCSSCSQQLSTVIPDTSSKTILVSFTVDGKKKNINNRFSFTIVHNKDTIQAKMIGNRLIVPEVQEPLGYTILFKYKKHCLSFTGISRKMLFPDQGYVWDFGVDNRPFDEALDLMSSDKYKTELAYQLQYLRLGPLEFGDGIQFINRISKASNTRTR